MRDEIGKGHLITTAWLFFTYIVGFLFGGMMPVLVYYVKLCCMHFYYPLSSNFLY